MVTPTVLWHRARAERLPAPTTRGASVRAGWRYLAVPWAAVFGALAVLDALGRITIVVVPGELPGLGSAFDWAVIAGLGLLVPFGFAYRTALGRERAVEERLADLVRDLAEARRSGLSLAAGWRAAARREYGALTPEVRAVARQIAFGVPVPEAVRGVADRWPTPLVRRTVAVLLRADASGGRTADALEIVAENVRAETRARAARRATAVTYVAIVYIAFAVFLVTVFVLGAVFLPPLATAGGGAFASSAGLAPDVFGALGLALAAAVVVHAVGDGVVIGVLSTGRAGAGLLHAAALVAAGWVVMRLFLPAFGGG